MKASEFLIVVAWVGIPPFVVGFALLYLFNLRAPTRRWIQWLQACALLALLGVVLAVGLLRVLPYPWRFQDWPVYWAPFVWLAVAIAWPAAFYWIRRPPVA